MQSQPILFPTTNFFINVDDQKHWAAEQCSLNIETNLTKQQKTDFFHLGLISVFRKQNAIKNYLNIHKIISVAFGMSSIQKYIDGRKI